MNESNCRLKSNQFLFCLTRNKKLLVNVLYETDIKNKYENVHRQQQQPSINGYRIYMYKCLCVPLTRANKNASIEFY